MNRTWAQPIVRGLYGEREYIKLAQKEIDRLEKKQRKPKR